MIKIIFDKSIPLTKEFCEHCKKEIMPGERMIILVICPSKERQLHNRLWSPGIYGFIDIASKYHEKCYIRIIKKK